MSMLKVSDVTAGYGQTVILQDISIEVGQGEVVTIIGANGAGKTTLLRAISGLVKPKSGSITFNGERIDRRHPPTSWAVASSWCPRLASSSP